MSDEDCEKDLVRCRDRGAPAALTCLDQIRKRQKILDIEEEVKAVHESIESKQRPFRDHPDIQKFQKQFDPSTYGVQARFKMLVLIGDTQQGKTSKAMSLWGSRKTLKLQCGNCPAGALPSLGSFDRGVHKALVFDEIRVEQVMLFRELFQANQHIQTLGTSACNPYAYCVWVYHTAMILCANSFDVEDENLSLADRKWLKGNTIIVQLPEGEVWFETS